MSWWRNIKDAVTTSAVAEGLSEVGTGTWGLIKDSLQTPAELIDVARGKESAGSFAQRNLSERLGNVGQVMGGAQQATLEPVLGATKVEKLNEGLNWAWTNLADEPLATVQTQAGKAMTDGIPQLLDPQQWRSSYELVNREQRTAGQAWTLTGGVALGRFGLTDVDSVEGPEAQRFLASDWAQVTANTFDVMAPFVLDPAVLAGRAAALGRTTLIVKPVKADADFAALAANDRATKALDFIHRARTDTPAEASARIRHTVFPNHPDGDLLAQTFAESNKLTDHLVLRAAYGDLQAVNDLENINIAVARKTQRLLGDRQVLRESGATDVPYDLDGQMFLPLHESSVAKIDAELRYLYPEETRALRRAQINGQLANEIRLSKTAELRDRAHRSEWYTKGGVSLRAVFQGRPTHLIYLDEHGSDIQVQRAMAHTRFDPATRQQARAEYLAASTSPERQMVWETWRDRAVQKIFDDYGYHPDDVAVMVANMKTGMQAATGMMKTQRAFDGEGRSKVTTDDGGRTEIALNVAQNEQTSFIPDFREVERMAQRYRPGRILSREGARNVEAAQRVSRDTLELFNRNWKFTTLARVAYPLKVIPDEQLRIAAQLSVMANLSYAKNGILNKISDANQVQNRTREARAAKEAQLGRALDYGELSELRSEIRKTYRRTELTRGFRDLEINGRQVEPVLGAPGALTNEQVASRRAYQETFGIKATENVGILEAAMSKTHGTGQWRDSIEYPAVEGALDPVARQLAVDTWDQGFLRATNRQLGSDPVSRMMLQGLDDKAIIAWTRSPQGAEYRRSLDTHWQRHPEQWLRSYRGQVDAYLDTPALRQAALDAKVTKELADREFAGRTRPLVHGEVLAQHQAGHALVAVVNETVNKIANGLFSLPTTILSRNQLANHVYVNEVQRLMDLHDVQTLKAGGQRDTDGVLPMTAQRQAQIEAQAKRKAVTEVRKRLYDLAEESDLGHLLRFVSPFFNAWQEAITVWGRLAVEKPQVVGFLHNIWEAPDRAGITYTDPNTGEDYLAFPVPDWAREHFEGLRDVKDVRLSKRGFNMIMQGLPGVGPTVGIPVSQIVKNRPDVAANEIVKLAFPYGAPTSVQDAVLPTTIRNLIIANSAEDTDAFTRNWRMIYIKELTAYRLGQRQTKPDMADIETQAHAMTNMRSLLQSVAPSGVSFNFPLQSYFDLYKSMMADDERRKKDGSWVEGEPSADERFYDSYGPEYFAISVHASKSINGVPPTVEGFKSYGKHKDLIDEFPEWGRAIIGQEGAGVFSGEVYKWQRTHRAGPGSSQNMREPLEREEFATEADVQTGWAEFNHGMQVLYAALEERGLTNFTDKGAQDLRQIKKGLTLALEAKYPEWGKDYFVLDVHKWQRKIGALAEISAAPSLTGRPEWEGVREYLDLRTTLTSALAERKSAGDSGALDAKGNADLADLWEAATSDLVRRNAAFSSFYTRYLSNDVLMGA